jgi:hypothetical protein
MRKLVLVAIAVVVGLVIAARPRDAKACGGLVAGDEGAVLVVAGAWAGLTLPMAAYDLGADDPGQGYGVAEALVHTPLALASGVGFLSTMSDDYHGPELQVWLGGLTALHTTLAIHGWHTAGKYRKPKAPKGVEPMPRKPKYGPPSMVSVGGVRANVTLTPVSDGRTVGGGLGLAGTF